MVLSLKVSLWELFWVFFFKETVTLQYSPRVPFPQIKGKLENPKNLESGFFKGFPQIENWELFSKKGVMEIFPQTFPQP